MLSKKQINQLIKVMEAMQEMLAEASRTDRADAAEDKNRRTRRSGKELVAFKRSIKAERKAGASVSDLARKYGVTPSYIYQL